MATYHFITLWHFDAPIQTVWHEIIHSETWPEWWPAVEQVEEIAPGEADGVGNVRRFVWKTPLRYKLAFETRVQRMTPPTLLEAIAKGDVDGVGLWQLTDTEPGTLVRYRWTVTTTKPWMNYLALIIRPLMEWNHNQIMKQGGEALARRLGAHLIYMESSDTASANTTQPE